METRLYTAAELIEQFGQHQSDRTCGSCDKRTLYAIRYPDDRGTVLLCQKCDLPKAGS